MVTSHEAKQHIGDVWGLQRRKKKKTQCFWANVSSMLRSSVTAITSHFKLQRCWDGREKRGIFRGGLQVSEVPTRPRTRRPSAWCCPCGSDAGSCTCRGRPGRSLRAVGRSGSSCCGLGRPPALSSGPVEAADVIYSSTMMHFLLFGYWKQEYMHGLVWLTRSCFCRRSFFSASVSLSSSSRWLLMSCDCSSAL